MDDDAMVIGLAPSLSIEIMCDKAGDTPKDHKKHKGGVYD
jgi:hypothetical protein